MRAILIGDGQIHLFDELNKLISYIEWYDADSAKHVAFDESGKKYKVSTEPYLNVSPEILRKVVLVPQLDQESNSAQLRDLLNKFIKMNYPKLCLDPFESPFDFIESNWGFTV